MFSVVFVCQSVCPRGSPCGRCMGLHIPLSHGQLGLSEDLLKFWDLPLSIVKWAAGLRLKDLLLVNLHKRFPDGIWGDSHYYRLFQTQLLDIKNSNGAKTLASEGVVDISDAGDWKVSGFCHKTEREKIVNRKKRVVLYL